ncbi:hypothetical protein Vadar_033245 [Vaccinium darrowii]|uniref:Uncharacterized protein n=1 Tax=Vaccinium darrowii TaxID=229202 RepID=A0ACB7ZGH9_9ERIC|nr:hypothetical protein Vadar_033245 [Vaccinium darrowii]
MTMKNMVRRLRTQNDIPPDPKSKTKKSQSCKLAVGSLDNIVAHGTMFEKVGPEEPLHTVPLGEANFRGVSKSNGVAGNKATSRNVDSDKILESLRSFDDYVEMVEYNEAYTITLDEDLFGSNVELPIQMEDMEHVSQMKELSLACIMLYMNHLFRVIKSANLERKFLFVNPSAISGTTKQLIGGSKSALLASLLKDAENDQLVFIPHVAGFHWVLFVIDLSYPMVFGCDHFKPLIVSAEELFGWLLAVVTIVVGQGGFEGVIQIIITIFIV